MSSSSERILGATELHLEGRDALSLLHRITTQHLIDLAPGEVRSTLFCDFRGRLLHRVVVVRVSEDEVILLREDAPPEELVAALERQIFREDVRVTIGSRALIAPYGDVTGPPERDRIRRGGPRHGHEIHPDFNPFEVGLAREVHLDKGCFTGQEALLRMMTYGGVRRRLALLEGDGAPPAPRREIQGNGAAAGIVTSSVAEGDRWIGLGVVRRDALDADATFTVAGERSMRVTPFPDERPLGLPDPPAR